MTHWTKWIWATKQLSTHKKDAFKLNLNANTFRWDVCGMCHRLVWMLMNYKWMSGREAFTWPLSHESVVRQSGKPASQTSLLRSGWPSDQPDWLVWPDTLFFHSHDLHPHWWRKMCLVCGWLGFRLGCQGMELWTRPELSGTLAECPHYSRQTHTHINTCSGCLTPRLCYTKHRWNHVCKLNSNMF